MRSENSPSRSPSRRQYQNPQTLTPHPLLSEKNVLEGTILSNINKQNPYPSSPNHSSTKPGGAETSSNSTQPGDEASQTTDMYSGLPRPGGSKLPAPASSSTNQQPLSDLGESTMNSRIGFSQSTIGRPSGLKTPAPNRTGGPAYLKRPASSLDQGGENVSDRPTQVARSAISQAGVTGGIRPGASVAKPMKSSVNLKASVSGRPGGITKPSGMARPNTSMAMRGAQAPAAVPEDAYMEDEKPASNAPKKRPQRAGWDVKGRLQDIEEDHRDLLDKFASTMEQKDQSSMKGNHPTPSLLTEDISRS